MKKYLTVILAGMAFCLAGCIFASGDTFTRPQPFVAKSGAVAGVEGGYGFLNTPEATYPNDYATSLIPSEQDDFTNYSTTTEKGHFVWGVHVGYDFAIARNLTLGIEGGYKDLGYSKYTLNYDIINVGATTSIRASRKTNEQAFDMLLTGHWYPWRGLNLFAKGGVAYVGSTTDQDVQYGVTIVGRSPIHIDYKDLQPWDGKYKVWRFRPEVALGVGYLFSKHFNVYVMYDHIGFGTNTKNWFSGVSPLTNLAKGEIDDSNAGFIGFEYKI